MKIRAVLQALLFCLLSAVILAFCSYLVKEFPEAWSQHAMLLGSLIFTFFMTLGFAWWTGLSLEDIGAAPRRHSARRFVLALMLGLMLPFIQWLIVVFAGGYQPHWNEQANLSDTLFAFALYILIAAREELAFRAFPLFSLNKKLGITLSIGIVTFIFILEHLAGGMTLGAAVIGSGLGGVLYGTLAIRTRGIAVPMGVHTGWNFGQWILGLKQNPGLFPGVITTGKEEWVDITGWIGYGVAMTIAIAIAIFYSSNNKE